MTTVHIITAGDWPLILAASVIAFLLAVPAAHWLGARMVRTLNRYKRTLRTLPDLCALALRLDRQRRASEAMQALGWAV